MNKTIKDFQLMIIYLCGEKETKFCAIAKEYQQNVLNQLEEEGLIVQHKDSGKVELTPQGLQEACNITPVVF